MKPVARVYKTIFAMMCITCVLSFNSCDLYGDMEICPDRNTVINFRYYLSPQKEELKGYIYSQTHLLFKDGVLAGKLYINGSRHAEGLLLDADASLTKMEANLPEGNYTMVSWSNYEQSVSLFEPLLMNQTRQEDILLSLVKPSDAFARLPVLRSNSERLYNGFCSFRVDATEIVEQTVDMLCAHAQIDFTVRWKNIAERPDMQQPIYLRMAGLPADYLMQTDHSLEFALDNTPTVGGNKALMQVPKRGNNEATIAVKTGVQSLAEVTARTVSYRLWDNSHPIVSLWTGADGNTRLMKEIDLYRLFNVLNWKMNNNLQQYFQILIVIDGDKAEMSAKGETGWIDGGSIGF